jgi:hypothetical protein
MNSCNFGTSTEAAQVTSVHWFEDVCTESGGEQCQTQCAAAQESLRLM